MTHFILMFRYCYEDVGRRGLRSGGVGFVDSEFSTSHTDARRAGERAPDWRLGLGRKPPILVRVRASPRSLGLAGVAPSEEGSLISMMKAFFALLFWRSHWGERVPVVKPVSPGQYVHKNNKKKGGRGRQWRW